ATNVEAEFLRSDSTRLASGEGRRPERTRSNCGPVRRAQPPASSRNPCGISHRSSTLGCPFPQEAAEFGHPESGWVVVLKLTRPARRNRAAQILHVAHHGGREVAFVDRHVDDEY